jgi:hypothetical protein
MGSFRVAVRRILFLLAIGALPLVALIAAGNRSTVNGPVPPPSVPMFGGNAQHTAIYEPAAQDLNTVHWSTSVDLNNSGAYAHYGAPLITAANTVLVPVKILNGSQNGFQVSAFDGGTGAFKYTVGTDYVLPNHQWIPVYNPCLTTAPFGTRLYYAGRGGTVYYIDNPDSAAHGPPVQQVFYTDPASYLANASAYNSTIFINTPLTADSNGNVFFGFRVQGTAPDPLNSNASGFARIDPNGNGTYILTRAAANDNSINWDSHNSAPALNNDETTLYVLAKSSGNEQGYLLGLDSTTLAPKYRVFLRDPRNGNGAGILDNGTASPTVAPDNDVYIGVLGNPGGGFRGWLLRFNGDLTVEKTPGAFGWDYTPALVPASMVPSYQGPSSYLIFAKYNHYAFSDGDGVNRIALLDPNTTQIDPHPSANGLVEMREVFTMIGPTPDQDRLSPTYPYAVREWCINTAAVNPATNSIFVPNENGRVHRWNLATNSLSQAASIGPGIGQPYVPTIIGPDGQIYTMNGGTLFALGGLNGVRVTLDSSLPDTRAVVAGESLTFTATVTNTGAPGPAPTGTVTFQAFTYQNLTPVTTTLAADVPLDANGRASVTTSDLAAGNGFLGNHFITATYSGDANYVGGSTTLVQKVHAHDTITTVSSSANPSAIGETVTVTATVTSVPAGSGTPTGMVTFQEGSTILAQVPLNGSGTASFQTSTLTPGDHTITAIYASDTVFAASSGNTVHTVAAPITPTPTPTPTPTGTATPSPTPTASPSPTPTATAAQAVNLSTRMRVRPGDNVGIGGFIITGTAPKQVLLRAIGPSLTSSGISEPFPDPVLELHGSDSFVTITNDDWRDDPVQEQLIKDSGIPPTNDLESAIHATLVPGAYTAVFRGKDNSEGVGLVEIYDLNPGAASKLGNISTRALVSMGDNIVIAGFMLGQHSGADRVAVRGLGPSLSGAGIANPLSNPILELRDGNGTLRAANNDWQDNPAQAAALTSAGLAPADQLEAGIIATLPPGLYTALLAGLNNGIGIGLVEVYDLGP